MFSVALLYNDSDGDDLTAGIPVETQRVGFDAPHLFGHFGILLQLFFEVVHRAAVAFLSIGCQAATQNE